MKRESLDRAVKAGYIDVMSTEAMDQPSQRKAEVSTLFPILDLSSPDSAVPAPTGRPRVKRANRHQIAMRTVALDALLPEDHQARLVWEYVERLDLAPLYEPIRAVEGHAGRDAIDPKILMAVWLYATLDGVGSARQLDGLCREHVAYEWICGGVSVNYHTLSDFRTAHVELLDKLLTQSVATLIHQELVTLHRVAQDGMRVRASAGAASFRRRKTLEQCQAEAAEQVEALQKDLDADPGGSSKRQQAARRRAARERSERIRRALDELPELESKKKAAEKDKARASTTDPEARVMKMGDGGFRPAHNVQFGTDTKSQVISEVIAEWRRRMGTPEAQEIYKERASTAECVNAIARTRGLRQFLVRGLSKVRAVALWFALAHNLMRAVVLRAEAIAMAG